MAHPVYNNRAWRNVRGYVLTRDRQVCQLRYKGCTTWATEVDHITPHAHGGSWYDPANLQAACKHCNASKRWRDGDEPYAPARAW